MKSYQQAVDHYNSINKPPRARYWNTGDGKRDNGKPLRRTAEGHMAIHKTDDNIIYYRLYDTHVATFYPPEADGSYKITTKYVPTQTTGIFMDTYHLNFHTQTTTEGESVAIPYVQHGSWRDNDKVTATLYYNKDHALIKERSSHQDVYTMVSSPEDKAKRKELRAKVEHLITLALFKLPQLKEDATIEECLGQPFATSYRNSPRELDHLKQYLRNHELDINDNIFVDSFMSSLQGAFDLYASKVCYDAGLFKWKSFWDLPTREAQEEAHKQYKLDQQEKRLALVADLPSDGFRKSLTNMLLSATNTKVGSVKKPWGQFMPKLPRKWIA